MRSPAPALAGTLAALVVAGLGGCGTDTGGVATDPGSSPSGVPIPTEVPAAAGVVHTRQVARVMDTGRPELCLGPVAESYPPQCGGPAILGWDWAEQRGMFERVGDVRWGQFAVSGTFDGTTFTVRDAVPAALYDPPAPEPSVDPSPARDLTEDQLASIAEKVGGALAGAQGAYSADGQVFVDVLYDDGSLQAWADEAFGTDVVVVTSALVHR